MAQGTRKSAPPPIQKKSKDKAVSKKKVHIRKGRMFYSFPLLLVLNSDTDVNSIVRDLPPTDKTALTHHATNKKLTATITRSLETEMAAKARSSGQMMILTQQQKDKSQKKAEMLKGRNRK